MIINNPILPFKIQLGTGLTVGTKICITGRVLENIRTYRCGFNFIINLCKGWDGSVKAFKLNPRFAPYYDHPDPEDVVVCATHVRGNEMNCERDMSHEERPERFPFRKGKSFKIDIVCEEEQFKVEVDAELLLNYKYRQPLANINVLEIIGQLDIFTVELVLGEVAEDD